MAIGSTGTGAQTPPLERRSAGAAPCEREQQQPANEEVGNLYPDGSIANERTGVSQRGCSREAS